MLKCDWNIHHLERTKRPTWVVLRTQMTGNPSAQIPQVIPALVITQCHTITVRDEEHVILLKCDTTLKNGYLWMHCGSFCVLQSCSEMYSYYCCDCVLWLTKSVRNFDLDFSSIPNCEAHSQLCTNQFFLASPSLGIKNIYIPLLFDFQLAPHTAWSIFTFTEGWVIFSRYTYMYLYPAREYQHNFDIFC